MSSIITGTNIYPTGFAAPDDGDNRDAASVDVGLGALADRTEYLKARLVDAYDASAPPHLGATTVKSIDLDALLQTTQTVMGPPFFSTTPGFFVEAVSIVGGFPSTVYVQGNGTASKVWAIWPIKLPVGAQLVNSGPTPPFSATVAAIGAVAWPALAADRLQLGFFRQPAGGGAMTSIPQGNVLDNSVNLAGYIANHVISTTTLLEVILAGYQYWVGLRTDINGYGAVASFQLNWVATALRPGGA